ncbi:hypothetical protein ABZ601_31480 [Streptomyces sp. NPDC012842]|uniref:hypothetical protein n=1 Tax=Streptomyces TaxID=1883 RepID=UPI0033CFB54D
MFVFGVGAGAEGEDLVVNLVGEAVEQNSGRALEPAFGISCWWGRPEDGGEPGGQEQAVADGVGQFAAQRQAEALFRSLAGGDGRLFVRGGCPVRGKGRSGRTCLGSLPGEALLLGGLARDDGAQLGGGLGVGLGVVWGGEQRADQSNCFLPVAWCRAWASWKRCTRFWW